MTAEECPRISAEYLAIKQETMPERWFLQEFRAQFLDPADAIFTSDMVLKALDSDLDPIDLGI